MKVVNCTDWALIKFVSTKYLKDHCAGELELANRVCLHLFVKDVCNVVDVRWISM